MLVARNPILMLAGVAALSHASVKILPNLCLLWQNVFVQVMLKWSKDRFVHRLHFMGSLTWKA